MKTFKSFLCESSIKELSLPKLIKGITSDCKPFWSQMGKHYKNGKYLWRGVASTFDRDFAYSTVRQDRNPRDTNSVFHKLLDDYLYETFGFRYRSQGLFATTDIEIASDFGDPYIIFPTGDVKACWSNDVTDVFDAFFSSADRHIFKLAGIFGMSDTDIRNKLKEYDLYLPIDDTWSHPNSNWFEFGTFKAAMNLLIGENHIFRNALSDDSVLKQLDVSADTLKDRLIYYFTDFIFPKIEYKEGTLDKAIKYAEGSEIMIKCPGYYLIFKTATDDDGVLEKKITDQLINGFSE